MWLYHISTESRTANAGPTSTVVSVGQTLQRRTPLVWAAELADVEPIEPRRHVSLPRARAWQADLACVALAGVLGFGSTLAYDAAIERDARSMLVDQVAARAADEVSLGVAPRITAADFEPPFTPAHLDTLSARLEPLLGRAREGGSGLLRVDVIARDGTIVYSDLASRRGQVVSPMAEPLLAGALAGTGGASVRPLDSGGGPAEPAPAIRRDVARADVPISVAGQVVGAFVLYQELPASPEGLLPGLGALAAAVLAGLLRLLLRVRPQRRRPAVKMGHVAATGREPHPSAIELYASDVRPSEPRAADPKLTSRELDVLRLLADDRTYRDIATELLVSEETVRSHVRSILRKLGQPDRWQAARAARFENLL